MTDFCYDSMTKAQVDGVKELLDLCRNGYTITFSSRIHTAIAYGLRHPNNGRRLTMFIGCYHYRLTENGSELKAVYYDSEDKIIEPQG